jgi:hypothetical protein
LRREHGVKERTAVRYLHASRSQKLEIKLGIVQEYPAATIEERTQGSDITGVGIDHHHPAWGSKLDQPYPGCVGVQTGGLCVYSYRWRPQDLRKNRGQPGRFGDVLSGWRVNHRDDLDRSRLQPGRPRWGVGSHLTVNPRGLSFLRGRCVREWQGRLGIASCR